MASDQFVYGNQDVFTGNILMSNPTVLDRDIPKIRPNGLLAKLAVPCQTVDDYDNGDCYTYYANGCYNVCQFMEVGDIEDFM